jgi:hypothetical protein
MAVKVKLRTGNVLVEAGDVLILKHAQSLYGVDAAVVRLLRAFDIPVLLPGPSEFRLHSPPPGMGVKLLLFVGVPPLIAFDYGEIRSFARRAMMALKQETPQAAQVLLTLHGVGFGLDEKESFAAEIAGLVDAVTEGDHPESLETISIVERNPSRAERLAVTLRGLLPYGTITGDSSAHPQNASATEKLRTVGKASDAKAHVFVAMPFKEEMDDVYHYGIQSAINAAGLLCERADLQSFTGDVLDWIRLRIRSASLVVADLTDANPNVYLEVGYAWGIGVPTVLLAKSSDHLKFDVRGQRCLVYRKIKELEDLLTVELKSIPIRGR